MIGYRFHPWDLLPRRRTGADTRLLELDALRGVASLAVLVFHYTFRYNQIFADGDEERGADGELGWLRTLGVPLFFIISGFVIPMTLDRGLDGTRGVRGRVVGVWNFVAARFARLYPAFWAAAAITFAAVAMFGLEGREVGWRAALANLSMIPRTLDSLGHRFGLLHPDERLNYIDGAYWSLAAEWFFYALVALIALVGLRRWLHWVLGAMVLIDLMRPNGLLRGVVVDLGAEGLVRQIGRFTLPSQAQTYFLSGLLIYEQRRFAARGETRWWIAPLMLLCFIRVASRRDDLTTAMYALDVAMVWAAVNFQVRWLANPVLIFAGTISYSLYLVHQNIGYIVINRTTGAGWPRAAAVAAAFVVAVSLATAITFLIERPCNTALRRWLMRKPPPRVSEPPLPDRSP